MIRYLITGANGFVGRALCKRLLAEGDHVTAVGRATRITPLVDDADAFVSLATSGASAGSTASVMPVSHENVAVRQKWLSTSPDFVDFAQNWPGAGPVDVAIHLAARVHLMQDTSSDPMQAYRETNVQGALRVAEAAARAGARKFVFVSSVKAMGEREPGVPPHPWRETDACRPADPYGVTKYEAEQALAVHCARLGLHLSIVRPPLVYGPEVRANFLQLMRLGSRGWPLPLGAVEAQRSMIYIDNLVDALVTLSVHPDAAGNVFNVSDGEDLSVAAITTILAHAMGREARMISVPPGVLFGLAKMVGHQAAADRILRPLRIDIAKIRRVLSWEPPISPRDGLAQTAFWYRDAFMA